MDFPAYVPAAVRAFISFKLDGDDTWLGYEGLLADAKQKLATTDEKISTLIQSGDVETLDELRKTRSDLVEEVDAEGDNIETLHRLGSDERMREAYALLTKEFTDDRQWEGFIDAGFWGRLDFAEHRESRKQLVEMKSEIAKVAERLAFLLRSFEIGSARRGPEEFVSIPELLRKTDSRRGSNHYKWHVALQYLLGHRPYREFNEANAAAEQPSQPYAPKNHAEEMENVRRHGWLPDFPSLLDTVAEAARNYEVRQSGLIEAAISTRQHNEKTAYIRAFGHVLTDRGFTLTRPIMKAMAIVASVAINAPDIDVTYDDVRKTLGKPANGTPENSGQK